MIITECLSPEKVIHNLRGVDQQADHFPLIVGQIAEVCRQREISVDIRSRLYDLQWLESRFRHGLFATSCNHGNNSQNADPTQYLGELHGLPLQ